MRDTTELEKIRQEKGMSHEAVAKACKISRAAYTNIENGKRNPSPPLAQKIGKVLGFDWTLFYTKWNKKKRPVA